MKPRKQIYWRSPIDAFAHGIGQGDLMTCEGRRKPKHGELIAFGCSDSDRVWNHIGVFVEADQKRFITINEDGDEEEFETATIRLHYRIVGWDAFHQITELEFTEV